MDLMLSSNCVTTLIICYKRFQKRRNRGCCKSACCVKKSGYSSLHSQVTLSAVSLTKISRAVSIYFVIVYKIKIIYTSSRSARTRRCARCTRTRWRCSFASLRSRRRRSSRYGIHTSIMHRQLRFISRISYSNLLADLSGLLEQPDVRAVPRLSLPRFIVGWRARWLHGHGRVRRQPAPAGRRHARGEEEAAIRVSGEKDGRSRDSAGCIMLIVLGYIL